MACGSDRCCSFPQGRPAVQALLWSIFAYLFCASATTGCYFMEIDGYLAAEEPFTVLNNVGSSTIGPFGYQRLETDHGFYCNTYNEAQIDNIMDASWKTARAFAVMANIFNGVCLLFLVSASCVKYKESALKIIAALAFSGSVCELCVFSFFGSWVTDPPQNGRFHLGAGLCIVGALSSLVTGLMVLKIPQEPKARNWRVAPPPNQPNNNSSATTGPYTPSGPQHFVPQTSTPAGKRNFSIPAKRGLQETAPPKPGIEVDPAEAFAPGTETITETILPDGSKKTTKTVVGLDGSKTVTETIVKEDEK